MCRKRGGDWSHGIAFSPYTDFSLDLGESSTFCLTGSDPFLCISLLYAAGIALFVTLIGIVGASLTNVDRSASQFEKKMDTIQQLLKLRDIPQTTAQRVLSFYFYLWNSRRVIDEDDLLSDLPSYLRKKIAREANRTILKKIKFLSECRESLLEDLMLCLKFHVALPGTIITHAGEKGKEMYFIASGCLDVFTGDDCYITTLEYVDITRADNPSVFSGE